MIVRDEAPPDREAIRDVVTAAFARVVHSRQTEARIVDALRAAGALAVSLVAVEGGELLGHVGFSKVTIDGADVGWYGLGPVAVRPDRQGAGIGSALVRAGLDRLRAAGAAGCVVLGEPAYYGRFGFQADDRLRLPGVEPRYFQALPFGDAVPAGTVAYHPAFSAA